LGVAWKVQIDRGNLWFEVRGALTNIVLVGFLALFVPSLQATLEDFIVGVVCIFGSVVLVGFIHLVYAAKHMAAICLSARRPTNTAQFSRHHVLGVGDCGAAPRPSAAGGHFPAHETTRTVWWEHAGDASTK
jgi:hypothetical protein